MKTQSKKVSGKKMYDTHGHAIDFVARFMEMDAHKLAQKLSRSKGRR